MKIKLVTVLFLIMLVLVSCNNKTENNSSEKTNNSVNTSVNKVVIVQNPCELFDANQLANLFDIADKSLIEMYSRDKYGSTKQCQFIWQEKAGSVETSQIMIDITSKSEDMGSTFSKMLELDLQNGLPARENNQTLIIKPTPLEDFGNFAYHWAQPNFQNVQKITFQVNNEYRVDITYNTHGTNKIAASLIKSKLIQIGKTIKEKL